MTAKRIFNPKWWLIGFAVLHTLMFLVPQLFVTDMVVETNWGADTAPAQAAFYEFQMGVLGIGYTPMLLAMAFFATGRTLAKMTLATALGMAVVAFVNTYTSMAHEGYMDDMPAALMIGLPIVLFGGMLLSAALHLSADET